MRGLIAIAALVLALSVPARADNRAAAKQSYTDGARRYAIGDYPGALEAFKRSYLAFAAPDTLFNIGQCQRQLGHHEEAIQAYRNYLDLAPKGTDRAEVESLIAGERQAMSLAAVQQKPPPPVEKMPPPVEKTPPPRHGWLAPVVAVAIIVVVGAAVATALAFSLTHEPGDPSTSAGIATVRFP